MLRAIGLEYSRPEAKGAGGAAVVVAMVSEWWCCEGGEEVEVLMVERGEVGGEKSVAFRQTLRSDWFGGATNGGEI